MFSSESWLPLSKVVVKAREPVDSGDHVDGAGVVAVRRDRDATGFAATSWSLCGTAVLVEVDRA